MPRAGAARPVSVDYKLVFGVRCRDSLSHRFSLFDKALRAVAPEQDDQAIDGVFGIRVEREQRADPVGCADVGATLEVELRRFELVACTVACDLLAALARIRCPFAIWVFANRALVGIECRRLHALVVIGEISRDIGIEQPIELGCLTAPDHVHRVGAVRTSRVELLKLLSCANGGVVLFTLVIGENNVELGLQRVAVLRKANL